jgi:hypothetical protein
MVWMYEVQFYVMFFVIDGVLNIMFNVSTFKINIFYVNYVN